MRVYQFRHIRAVPAYRPTGGQIPKGVGFAAADRHAGKRRDGPCKDVLPRERLEHLLGVLGGL
ncbi:MAG TPA: hypothetical protein VLB86_02135, partial [Gaiellaceae bacterium]|nr:hypothetical protein [Gaiellaceae bacterium]